MAVINRIKRVSGEIKVVRFYVRVNKIAHITALYGQAPTAQLYFFPFVSSTADSSTTSRDYSFRRSSSSSMYAALHPKSSNKYLTLTHKRKYLISLQCSKTLA